MSGEDYEARKDEHRPDWPGYHLPECPQTERAKYAEPLGGPGPFYGPCICDRLRACERRVEASNQGFADMASFELGKREERKRSAVLIADAYASGLAAARDAVAAVPWFDRFALGRRFRADALAAIDALRGEA